MSKVIVQVPDHIFEEVKTLAACDGTSVHNFILSTIARRVGEMKAQAKLSA